MNKAVSAFVASSLLAVCGAASAQQTGNVRLAFDIQSKGLEAALTEFALATNLQVLFLSDIVPSGLAPRVSGSLTPEAALDQLLANSGLKYQFVNSRTVTIRAADADGDAGGVTQVLAAGEEAHRAPVSGIRLAQTNTSDGPRPTTRAQLQDTSAIPEVLIKGDRIRSLNTDIKRSRDGAQPHVVFEREVIEKSGATSVEEFLRGRLTAQTSFLSQAQSPGSGSNTSTIDLRGMGADQTLILIDGRRATPRGVSGATSQADINGIPLSAIERIEVLPATASGIYGGSAVGGVINIVRRRDYKGVETSITYGNSFEGGGSTRRVDLASSFPFEGGRSSIEFTASYSDATDLLYADRDIIARARERQLANNPASIYGPTISPLLGATTNIRSNAPLVNGVRPDLTLKPQYGGGSIGSPYTSVPYGYAGPASDNGAGLRANAGRYNLDSPATSQAGGGTRALKSSPTIKSFSTTFRREFTSHIDAFIDLSASENSAEGAFNSVSGTFTLQPTAIANPFNQAITITTPTYGAEETAAISYQDYRGVAGLLFDLPATWRGGADYTWGLSRTDATTIADASLGGAASLAVGSGTANGSAFNVFRDTNAFPVDFGPFLGVGNQRSPIRVRFDDIALRLAGPLPWSLPAGAPTLSFLVEHRKEAMDDVVQTGPFQITQFYARSQSIDSVYVEMRIPLLAGQNLASGASMLELQLAGRRDEYDVTAANIASWFPGDPQPPAVQISQKRSSTDPTVSLRFQPVRDVIVRGSFGTGFMPPAMNQLVPDPPFFLPVLGLTDPRRGGEPITNVTILGEGNPDLRPEESRSWSAGVVFQPRFAEGLRASIDWVRIKKKDAIRNFGITQATINDEALIPGFVTREPPSGGFEVGRIVEINGQRMNVSLQEVEALDFALDYERQIGSLGTFTISGVATRNLHNITQVSALSPEIENVGRIQALPWKGSIDLGWERAGWSASWTARYFDAYCLLTGCASNASTLSQGGPDVGAQLYHDVTLGYRFSDSMPLLRKTQVRLGVHNVFDKEPPIDLGQVTFYSPLSDPLSANYYLSITKGF